MYTLTMEESGEVLPINSMPPMPEYVVRRLGVREAGAGSKSCDKFRLNSRVQLSLKFIQTWALMLYHSGEFD
jgi:hypothetical protein